MKIYNFARQFQYFSEIGPGWRATVLDWETDRYIRLAQPGFSDQRNYFVGGRTYLSQGQSFHYYYYRRYGSVLHFTILSLHTIIYSLTVY